MNGKKGLRGFDFCRPRSNSREAFGPGRLKKKPIHKSQLKEVQNYQQGIFLTLCSWRPPSKGVSKKAHTISFASPGEI
jgi:hypothetical protein